MRLRYTGLNVNFFCRACSGTSPTKKEKKSNRIPESENCIIKEEDLTSEGEINLSRSTITNVFLFYVKGKTINS